MRRRGPRDPVSVLLRLTRALSDDRPLEDSLRRVTDAALVLVHADHASVRLLDATRTALLCGARSGAGSRERPLEFRRGEGILGWVVEHREPVWLSDAANDKRFVAHERQGFTIGSLIAEPLWSSGDVIGVLSVSAPRKAAFKRDDRLLIRLLANCSVSPIDKARLRRLAIVDDLTHAFNVRYLGPRLREEMDRARQAATPLSYLLMDLDHFKLVNDAHGHAAGDRVLREFAEVVRASVRRIDVLARRGGEEFALVMPQTNAREARAIAERIRATLAGTRLDVGNATAITQTVSIGAATWDGEESAEAFERRADEAMYAAKEAGRNRVMVSGPPVVESRRTLDPIPESKESGATLRGRRPRFE